MASRFHRRKGRELSTLELARIVYSPNPVGNILSWLAEPPDEEGYDRKRCQADSKIGLLQVQIAAHAYWQAHGELPAELEALVPDWLAAIPRDPFDGDALRYSADDARAWSVGDDFADEPVPPIPALTNPAEPSVSLRF